MNEQDNFDDLVHILDEFGINYLYKYHPITKTGTAEISEHIIIPFLNTSIDRSGKLFTVKHNYKTNVFMNSIAFENINGAIHICNKKKRIVIRIPSNPIMYRINELMEQINEMRDENENQ